jgi:polysaccharide biosynthesis protein PslJ
MMPSIVNRAELILFNSDRRIAALGLAGLLLLGALMAALLIAVAGPVYALAAFLVVCFGLLILRDMRWGLVALFAVISLLPFAALPFKLGFTPTFLDIALLALCFVWLIRIATRREPGLAASALGIPLLIFFFLAVFAFANGLRFSTPTPTTIRNFSELALGMLFFFLTVNILRSEADLFLVARLIMVAGAGAAAVAIIFYVIPQTWTIRVLDGLARFNYPGGAGALRYIEDNPENPMRAIGTMVDPNVLGGFLILVAGLTVPQLVSSGPLFRRRWVILFFVLDLVALYLTYSRGSLVGLAAGLVVIGLLRYRKLLLVGLAGVALLFLLPPAQAYVAHFVEGIQLQDRATLMRLGEYKDALALIGRYPWFGVGFSGSPDSDLYVGVSNLYLLIAEEMGALGLAWFLGLMIIFLASLARTWRKGVNSRLESLLLGLLAATTAVMVGGLLDHYLFNLVYPHMSTFFWIFIGLGMSVTLVAEGRWQMADGFVGASASVPNR